MRAYDWTATPLGPPAAWPRSLKTAVRIMLTSRQPIWLGWGPDLTYLYNDPYKSIIGGKHPHALGRPFREVWREIWDVVGPMADTVMARDEGTYVEAQLLIMERHGYQEETYYTFSYSPVPDDAGRPGGLICANTDDTLRVVGERQLATLRELAAATMDSRDRNEACALSIRALETNERDVPFALFYITQEGRTPRLVASSQGSQVLHRPDLWPWAQVVETNQVRVVSLEGALGAIPRGGWPRPPFQAALMPVSIAGPDDQSGLLVVGLNPFRQFDENYRGFLDLAARQIAAGIGNAEAYEQERRRAEALAEIDRAKTAFFSNVSHEFRTPLTLMLGPLEDLLSQPEALSAKCRNQLEVAHRNSLRLLKLVNTLLDFSRIEAGRIRASFEPTDLAALTAELASVFRSVMERAQLRFIVDCPALPEAVYVDHEMWEKIVFNLLSNAFKFTFDGSVEVLLRQADEHAVLTVRDTGTGIPPAELPHVFERFHRVEGARGRTFEGSGIGLALVQELVKLHGGEVRVESEIGRGTTFSVCIPFGSQHLPQEHIQTLRTSLTNSSRGRAYVEELTGHLPEEPVEQSSTNKSADTADGLPRPRILLADDNADMRDYVRRLLSDRYAVEAVADGFQALAAARRQRPDLVLTDVMMPGMDGFALLQALRADERLASVPVIVLSARAGEEARVAGVLAGAYDYLVKPFSARELLAHVAGRLELSRLQTKVEEAVREADRRKDEFLATLSHELRNPLAPLRNSLYVLRKKAQADKGPASEDAIYQMMERQLTHLVRLVDDLMEVSRISRGVLELRKTRVDVETVVRNAVEASGPLIEAAGHQLHLSLPSQPVWLDGDSVRLAQVLGNLLNNAARYTDRGGQIWLQARLEDRAVIISVRDSGIGISPAVLPTLFQMFARGEHSAERGQDGLGIGLALARRLAEMHGGSLQARSEGPGKGSEFILRLPPAG